MAARRQVKGEGRPADVIWQNSVRSLLAMPPGDPAPTRGPITCQCHPSGHAWFAPGAESLPTP
jgi:hypothetical protein